MMRLILIILLIPIIVIYTFIDFIVTFFIEKVFKINLLNYRTNFVKLVFKIVLCLSGVKANIKGKENIEALSNEKSYFIISNHRGFCDVVRGYLLFDKPTGIVAKKELAKIPVLSYWMKKINCVFLDRNDLRDGVKMIVTCINNISAGISMWIFPEGTRCKSKNPQDLLEFKSGSFKIAEKTNCYILPIAFKNTEYVFENQSPFIKASNIYINIGKAYKISDLNEDDKKDIGRYNQKIVKELIMEV